MERPAPKRPIKLPFTLGHENAGWVEKLGPGATGFAPGDPVIVYGPWGCGNCKNCRMSMENYCESADGTARGGGLGGYDGGMAPTWSFHRRASWFRSGCWIPAKPLR